MHSLTQHLAAEEKDIITISGNPGRTDTDMQKQLREQGKGHMDEAVHADFVSVHEQGKLNPPEGPGHVFARLVLNATPDLSGKVVRWDNPEAAAYRED